MSEFTIEIKCNNCRGIRYYTVLGSLDSLRQVIEWLQDELYCDECEVPYTGEEEVDIEAE